MTTGAGNGGAWYRRDLDPVNVEVTRATTDVSQLQLV